MICIIDTYAWIEYLRGSKQGAVLKRLLDAGKDKFITMECCLAEMKGYSLKNNVDFIKIYRIMKANSIILPVLTKGWVEAAEVRHELRKKVANFGLIDAILVAKQKELRCKVISGDPHFKSLKNIVYIGN